MTQPTALFLADVIDADADAESHHAAAAAELRRLHAQRDALLAALQRMANIIDQMGDMPDGFIHPSPWRKLKCEEALTQARAAIAIAKAEGENA